MTETKQSDCDHDACNHEADVNRMYLHRSLLIQMVSEIILFGPAQGVLMYRLSED
jgi:hypothetical protein